MTSSSAPPHPIRVVAAATGFGAVAVSAVLMFGIGMPTGETRIASLAVFAIALTLLLRKHAEGVFGRRGGAVLALAITGTFPCLALGACADQAAPIVISHFRCGTGEMALLMLVPFFVFFIGATSGFAAAFAFARSRRLLDRAINAVAAPCTLIALLVAFVAFGKSARSTTAGGYVASLPIAFSVGSNTIDAPTDLLFGDFAMRRQCDESMCTLELYKTARGSDRVPDFSGVPHWKEKMRTGAFEVRRDDAHGFVILETEGRPFVAFDRDGDTVDVLRADVADMLGPPPLWIATAGIGLLVAIGALASRRRLRAELARVVAGAAGQLERDEWIAFEGGATPLRKPHDLALEEGPVVVLDLADEERWAYRADGSRRSAIVIAGDKADVMAKLADAVLSRSALALAAIAVTFTPLAVAM